MCAYNKQFILAGLSIVSTSIFCMEHNNSIQDQLCKAVESGNILATQYLIKQGANIHAGSNVGDLLMHRAAQPGHMHMVKFLQSCGLSLCGYDSEGLTLLHKVAKSDSTELLNYLINNQKLNPDITTWDEHKCTPLHLAILDKKINSIKCLVCLGADVNAAAQYKVTPVLLAASFGYADVVDYLLQSGANQEARNIFGNDILDLAAMHNHPELVKLLVEKYCFDPMANNCKAYDLALEHSAQEAATELSCQMQKLRYIQ